MTDKQALRDIAEKTKIAGEAPVKKGSRLAGQWPLGKQREQAIQG